MGDNENTHNSETGKQVQTVIPKKDHKRPLIKVKVISSWTLGLRERSRSFKKVGDGIKERKLLPAPQSLLPPSDVMKIERKDQ